MSAIKFTIDGVEVEANEGETIWQVAQRHDVAIPHLCYSTAPTYRADGNCRACMVEIEGERVLAASCLRKPTEGMKVGVSTPRAEARLSARRQLPRLHGRGGGRACPRRLLHPDAHPGH